MIRIIYLVCAFVQALHFCCSLKYENISIHKVKSMMRPATENQTKHETISEMLTKAITNLNDLISQEKLNSERNAITTAKLKILFLLMDHLHQVISKPPKIQKRSPTEFSQKIPSELGNRSPNNRHLNHKRLMKRNEYSLQASKNKVITFVGPPAPRNPNLSRIGSKIADKSSINKLFEHIEALMSDIIKWDNWITKNMSNWNDRQIVEYLSAVHSLTSMLYQYKRNSYQIMFDPNIINRLSTPHDFPLNNFHSTSNRVIRFQNAKSTGVLKVDLNNPEESEYEYKHGTIIPIANGIPDNFTVYASIAFSLPPNIENHVTRTLEKNLDIPNLSWSPWSDWSSCSVTCGVNGVKSRYRVCVITNIPYNNVRCGGGDFQSYACSASFSCEVNMKTLCWVDSLGFLKENIDCECSQVPGLCLNNGICVKKRKNNSTEEPIAVTSLGCKCPLGYSGLICEFGWWSTWSSIFILLLLILILILLCVGCVLFLRYKEKKEKCAPEESDCLLPATASERFYIVDEAGNCVYKSKNDQARQFCKELLELEKENEVLKELLQQNMAELKRREKSPSTARSSKAECEVASEVESPASKCSSKSRKLSDLSPKKIVAKACSTICSSIKSIRSSRKCKSRASTKKSAEEEDAALKCRENAQSNMDSYCDDCADSICNREVKPYCVERVKPCTGKNKKFLGDGDYRYSSSYNAVCDSQCLPSPCLPCSPCSPCYPCSSSTCSSGYANKPCQPPCNPCMSPLYTNLEQNSQERRIKRQFQKQMEAHKKINEEEAMKRSCLLRANNYPQYGYCANMPPLASRPPVVTNIIAPLCPSPPPPPPMPAPKKFFAPKKLPCLKHPHCMEPCSYKVKNPCCKMPSKQPSRDLTVKEACKVFLEKYKDACVPIPLQKSIFSCKQQQPQQQQQQSPRNKECRVEKNPKHHMNVPKRICELGSNYFTNRLSSTSKDCKSNFCCRNPPHSASKSACKTCKLCKSSNNKNYYIENNRLYYEVPLKNSDYRHHRSSYSVVSEKNRNSSNVARYRARKKTALSESQRWNQWSEFQMPRLIQSYLAWPHIGRKKKKRALLYPSEKFLPIRKRKYLPCGPMSLLQRISYGGVV